jgi:hypothetical protein
VSATETIKRVLKDYHERISTLEDEKFDLEYAVKKKDFEVEFGFTTSRSSSSDTLCRCKTVSFATIHSWAEIPSSCSCCGQFYVAQNWFVWSNSR